jgi:hypothetical protein
MTPATPPLRPDMATYSQLQQISLGIAPTWNSPDITTNNDFPWTLLPAFLVNVRNLSDVTAAANVLVTLSTSAFGIGMAQTPMSSQKLNVGPAQTVSLMRVVAPYLVLSALTLLMLILIAVTRFPSALREAEQQESSRSSFGALLHHPHFLLAVAAQFAYVGAQVGTWSYLISYIQAYAHQPEKVAGYFLTGTLVLFGIGRFFSAWLMRFRSPSLRVRYRVSPSWQQTLVAFGGDP